MVSYGEFKCLSLDQKIRKLYQEGTFIMAIRYYNYKVNLYLLENYYLEVFINHKRASVERIALLDVSHSRMKFYSDQIKLPTGLTK